MKKRFIRIFVCVVVVVHIAMASVFISHEVFNFTSSNSALYFLHGKFGGIEIKRDLLIEDAHRLIFTLDANCVFNWLMKGLAIARQKPLLELTWNTKEGTGGIKQFRADGTMLVLSFSRSRDSDGRPKGLFLGGDLPYGDISRAESQDTSGFGYYDGEDWYHIWCASNEAFKLSGKKRTVVPSTWRFLKSRVLKNTKEEVILESEHEVELNGNKINMKRFVSFKAGEDYFLLRVRFTNLGTKPITYGYAWGDEPWVGHYGASKGDVGWYDDGLIQNEMLLSPVRHKYAGYWDYGNEAAGEDHNFSGYANFVEWLYPTPSLVFFSNSIENCCSETTPLASEQNRVINIVWLNQLLLPGESRDHILAIGMATVDPKTGMPKKPKVSFD
jgi:hypothetical protein